MKKQGLTFVGVLSLLLVAGSALAQAGEVRASVPFNFIVNHTTLPAGDYAISSTAGSDQVLVIRGMNGKTVKLVNANRVESAQPASRTKLVFRCYGDRYFLAQIWTQGSHRGRQLPKTTLESEVALNATSHQVVLMASLR
jgi:hypothetical protein